MRGAFVKKSQENSSKLYNYIKTYLNKNNYPPTVREMASHLNVKSTSTVAYYLDKLIKQGKIKKNPSKNRALEILEKQNTQKKNYQANSNINNINATTAVPMLGAVTAGQPILAVEEHDEVYNLPNTLFTGDELFMLNIKGESMINAGINEGDKIVVTKQNDAKNGDVVVALIEDEATVKTFYKEPNIVRLQPENDTMQPIYVKDVKVLGKVIGLIRKM